MGYFTAEHDALRQEVRAFVETEITPFVQEWEEVGLFPRSLFEKLGERGYLGLRYPKSVGGSEKDYFSAVVFAEEIARCGCGGIPMAIAVQTDMATPPILQFGSDYHIEKFVTPAIKGEKIGAIGITEPNHGSNVAGIETRARLEGDEYIINGTKMFITNGTRADFVTLVTRTSDAPGYAGISLIVVELDSPGVSLSKKLDKVGMRSSDTAELIFDQVRVPKENLLGEEGSGFAQIMWELQGERMISAPGSIGIAEHAYSIAYEHIIAHGEKTRSAIERLGKMRMEIERTRALTYAVAEEFGKGKVPSLEISIAKMQAAQMSHIVASHAMRIVGSSGLKMDDTLQRIWRDTRLYRIGAGADEIMKEIVAKQLKLERVSR